MYGMLCINEKISARFYFDILTRWVNEKVLKVDILH